MIDITEEQFKEYLDILTIVNTFSTQKDLGNIKRAIRGKLNKMPNSIEDTIQVGQYIVNIFISANTYTKYNNNNWWKIDEIDAKETPIDTSNKPYIYIANDDAAIKAIKQIDDFISSNNSQADPIKISGTTTFCDYAMSCLCTELMKIVANLHVIGNPDNDMTWIYALLIIYIMYLCNKNKIGERFSKIFYAVCYADYLDIFELNNEKRDALLEIYKKTYQHIFTARKSFLYKSEFDEVFKKNLEKIKNILYNIEDVKSVSRFKSALIYIDMTDSPIIRKYWTDFYNPFAKYRWTYIAYVTNCFHQYLYIYRLLSISSFFIVLSKEFYDLHKRQALKLINFIISELQKYKDSNSIEQTEHTLLQKTLEKIITDVNAKNDLTPNQAHELLKNCKRRTIE